LRANKKLKRPHISVKPCYYWWRRSDSNRRPLDCQFIDW